MYYSKNMQADAVFLTTVVSGEHDRRALRQTSGHLNNDSGRLIF